MKQLLEQLTDRRHIYNNKLRNKMKWKICFRNYNTDVSELSPLCYIPLAGFGTLKQEVFES